MSYLVELMKITYGHVLAYFNKLSQALILVDKLKLVYPNRPYYLSCSVK
jgi:hypothetical protein